MDHLQRLLGLAPVDRARFIVVLVEGGDRITVAKLPGDHVAGCAGIDGHGRPGSSQSVHADPWASGLATENIGAISGTENIGDGGVHDRPPSPCFPPQIPRNGQAENMMVKAGSIVMRPPWTARRGCLVH